MGRWAKVRARFVVEIGDGVSVEPGLAVERDGRELARVRGTTSYASLYVLGVRARIALRG